MNTSELFVEGALGMAGIKVCCDFGKDVDQSISANLNRDMKCWVECFRAEIPKRFGIRFLK